MYLKTLQFCVLILKILNVSVANDDALIVELPQGRIRGRTLTSANNTDFFAFIEIPYAAPPLGDNRFKEPQDPQTWDGVLNCTKNTKQCIQSGPLSSAFSLGLSEDDMGTEDCLYLNVYTPLRPRFFDVLNPVLVWIHGGAFRRGNGSYFVFGPEDLIDAEIVIVTLNYRLGPMGFLSTGDDVIPGNLALKDQRKALQWVGDNIHLFGGDADKVTIAGESAGGHSVSYLLLGQNTRRLFRGAIQQSGSALVPTSYSNDPKYFAFEVGKQLDKTFTSQNSSTDLLNLLRKTPIAELIEATDKVTSTEISTTGYVSDMIWAPIIENVNHRNAFLTEPMHESFIHGRFNRVPVMIGYNSEEAILFAAIASENSYLAAEYDENISLIISEKLNISPQDVSTAAAELKDVYTKSFSDDEAAFIKLSSDNGFTTGILRQAEAMFKYITVYLYQFSYRGQLGEQVYGPVPRPTVPGVEDGVGHAEELEYIWDTNALGDTSSSDSQTDLLIKQRMAKLWTNFVLYLDPTPDEDSLLQNVIWPPVQSNDLPFLNINETMEVRRSPRNYKRISDILFKYIKPPFVVF